jgi:hypothetical protein
MNQFQIVRIIKKKSKTLSMRILAKKLRLKDINMINLSLTIAQEKILFNIKIPAARQTRLLNFLIIKIQ